MKKKVYLLILVLMLFVPSFIYPIKTQQPKTRPEDKKIVPIANSSLFPFIFGTINGPNTLDPVNCWDRSSAKVLDQAVETLFTYNYSDPDLPLIPLLATSVSDISGGGLNYTIDLRQNVIFHDGTEFNATAAKWNFDRMEYWWNFTGDLPSYESLGGPSSLFRFEDGETPIWSRTEIVNEYSIKIVLNAPFVPFLDVLTYTAAAMVSPTSHGWDITSTIHTGTTKLPVGTGPFVMDSHIDDNETIFHAFENYWRVTADFNELLFYYYSDPMLLTTNLLNGSVHFIDQISQSLLPSLLADPNITVLDEGKTDSYIRYITFNNNLLEQTWRQALSYAINYSYLIKELMSDTVARLKSPVPEGILYSNYGFNYPEFNITLARMLLQSMGFGVGLNATYPGPDDATWQSASFATYSFWVYAPSSLYNNMYQLCRDWFDLIGITLVDVITNWAEFITNFIMDKDWIDMWTLSWVYDYNDPSNAINYLFSNATSELTWAINGQVNDSYLQNLMDQGLTETNPVVREATYNEIQRYTVEELMPYSWLWTYKLYHAHHINLTGFTQNVFNKYNFYDCGWLPFSYDIEILSSGDISFIKGTTGNIINWTISSDALKNAIYNIYVNDIFNTTGSWEIDEPIIINLDNLPASTYEYKIEVFNANNTAEDIVNVNVQPFIFEITHPVDINYVEGDTGNAILWTVTSNLISNPNYSIYVNDVLNRTGVWQSGEPIAINVDGLSAGSYEYRIEVYNLNTNIQDIVTVTVESPSKPKDEIPGYSVLLLVGISVIIILYFQRKLKKKLS
ncbi:MAG: ABC transporter substrate-binding protein [Candidatus Hodarchaeota archaeon]